MTLPETAKRRAMENWDLNSVAVVTMVSVGCFVDICGLVLCHLEFTNSRNQLSQRYYPGF